MPVQPRDGTLSVEAQARKAETYGHPHGRASDEGVRAGGATALKALDNVSLSIAQGEFAAIVGSSGSGKSTLLHLMGGVDRPTSGTVRLAGADVYARSDEELAVLRRREVGLVYQFYNLIPVLNVVENMTLPVLMDGRPVNEERLRTLLDGPGAARP